MRAQEHRIAQRYEPIHATQFVLKVDIKLEAHLYYPAELLEFVQVGPRGEGKPPELLTIILSNGNLAVVPPNLDIDILGFVLQLIPI